MTTSPIRRSASIHQLSRKSGIDVEAVIHDLRTTSDRGAAIIGGGLVELTIEKAIIGRLAVRDDRTIEKLSSRDGALQSFYGKIHLAYAMGVYGSDTKAELEAVRRIRNLFAHSMKPIDFKTNEVVIEARKLGMPKATDPSELSEHRQQFNLYCVVFLAHTHLKEIGRMTKVLHEAGTEIPDELKLKIMELMDQLRTS